MYTSIIYSDKRNVNKVMSTEAIWAIPAETAGNGKDNCIKKKFFKCAINVVKAVQVNISNAYMKLQSMN